MHQFHRAPITWCAGQLFAWHLARDDVDRQPSIQHLINGRQLSCHLRRPDLAAANGNQKAHPFQHWRNASGKGNGVNANRIAGRQQDVIKPTLFCSQHDIAAMFKTGGQVWILYAQKFIVIVAQGRKPADLAVLISACGHGSLSPLLATRTSYHCLRDSRTLKACAASTMRAGV